MSRRNIRLLQNIILVFLTISIIGMHHYSEKSKESKMIATGRKIAVSQSLKDCLKANASQELRDATRGVSAPSSRDNSIASFIAHFKSAAGRLSPSAYKDAYDTLDECGVGLFSGAE